MSLASYSDLRRLQRRVGRQPETPVHVPLEFGQVVELRRLDSLRLAFDAQDLEGMALHALAAPPGRPPPCAKRSPANLKMTSRYRVSSSQNGSGLKRADLVVAADDHGQHRRLDPTDAPEHARRCGSGRCSSGSRSGRRPSRPRCGTGPRRRGCRSRKAAGGGRRRRGSPRAVSELSQSRRAGLPTQPVSSGCSGRSARPRGRHRWRRSTRRRSGRAGGRPRAACRPPSRRGA